MVQHGVECSVITIADAVTTFPTCSLESKEQKESKQQNLSEKRLVTKAKALNTTPTQAIMPRNINFQLINIVFKSFKFVTQLFLVTA